jgi:hypoxanthine phosphoribosyltransferase
VTSTDSNPPMLKCFVIMPSGGKNEYEHANRESNFVYEGIIVPAVRDACGPNVKIVREADASAPGAIDRRIVENLATADIAIVDITGHNANVFLELGMRYVLKRSTTILLRQAHTAIPFDVAVYRHVDYDPKLDGIDKARKAITEAVAGALHSDVSDSLVYNVYPDLSVKTSAAPDSAARMSWDEFWMRFTDIAARLKLTIEDGRYKPHAVLGLSNGGMFVADMIARRLLTRTPVMSFWVNRWEKDGDWFGNPINEGLVAALRTIAPNGKVEDLDILLVDDIVASGHTLQEAIKFLERNLPKASVQFLPLFSANEKYSSVMERHVIWQHPAFASSFSDPSQSQAIHTTHRRVLPYDKDIRST